MIDVISNILLEQEISTLVDQGGLDALIYLCQPQQLPELHFEATTALAKFVLIGGRLNTHALSALYLYRQTYL